MQAWLYRVDLVVAGPHREFDETVESVLNEYGAEGWEAFSVVGAGEASVRIFFRKPME